MPRQSRLFEALGFLFNPVLSFKMLLEHRGLVSQLVIREISTQFKGSFLGFAWVFARPLLMLCVYTFVFGVIWPRDAEGVPLGAFAMHMFCGMALYQAFATSVNLSCSSVVSRRGFVKQVVFPLETLPFVQVASQFILFVAWLVILVAGVLFVYGKLPLTCLLLPVVLVPLFLISNGVAWFVASLNVYVRDLKQFVPVVLQMLYFVTPIFWGLDMLKGDKQWIIPYLYWNPFTGIVEMARDLVIRGVMLDWSLWGILTAVSFVVWQLGFVWFHKTKKGFADVI